jgi:hypothetical protein
MADIVINTKVQAPDLSPLQSLNKELKAAKAAAINGDGAAAKRVAELKDKMDDLKDATKSFQGSGVEKLKNSFGLLTEGFRNFDADKIKLSFAGIGSAMRAVPIFLIVEGIMKLIENFDKLKNSGGLLGTVFKAIGTIVTTLTDAVKDFSDWIGITNFEAEEFAQNQIDNAKKVQDAVSERYDIEIRLAKAAGKSTEEIEKQKVMAVRKSLLEQIQLKAKLAAMDGEINAEELKQLDELRKALTENYVQEKEIGLKQEKEKKESNERKKQDDKQSKAEELQRYKDLERQLSEARIAGAEIDRENRAMILADVNADKAKFDQEAADAEYAILVEGAKKAKDLKDQQEAEDKLRAERKKQIEANYWSAAGSLAGTFFDLQIQMAEGNEDRQNELRKKAFNIDKALKASQATIDGYKAVTSTLAQGGPLAIPLAASIGVLAFANVAKILATKFNAGGGSSGSASTPRLSTGGGNAQTPNQTQLPTNQPIQPTTQFDDQGNRINQPIVVKVSEINDVQRKVARVEEQATF